MPKNDLRTSDLGVQLENISYTSGWELEDSGSSQHDRLSITLVYTPVTFTPAFICFYATATSAPKIMPFLYTARLNRLT